MVRAAAGQELAGARLVRCPGRGGAPTQSLSFERPHRPARIGIAAPPGASAFVNGDPVKDSRDLAKKIAGLAPGQNATL